MLKRKIYETLRSWKSSDNKKSLILGGARQVGKTFIAEEFGKNEYEELVKINFKETPSATEIFAGDLDVDTLITSLRFRFPEKKIVPGKTLILLDEVQECEEAITSLKFWTSDRRYDVIATGSLLGIDYKRASSYPVGYVDYRKMQSLDFEEFLWGIGVTKEMIDTLHTFFTDSKPVPEAIHRSMMGNLRLYAATGGMPEAVKTYIDSKDFRTVDKVQRDLLTGYQYDIAHYASADEKVKAEKCFLSLAKQLLDKENHKFQYKELEKGARAQKYYSSIEWLTRADILRICPLVTDIRYDLDDYARNDFFRAYTSDLSLLIAMKDFSLKQGIIENSLSGNTKGGLYECITADIMYKRGYKLYFYKNETTRLEIDFIIQKEGKPVPIEVKSGNSRAGSLARTLKNRPDIESAYKLIDGNTGNKENGITSIPLYFAMFI